MPTKITTTSTMRHKFTDAHDVLEFLHDNVNARSDGSAYQYYNDDKAPPNARVSIDNQGATLILRWADADVEATKASYTAASAEATRQRLAREDASWAAVCEASKWRTRYFDTRAEAEAYIDDHPGEDGEPDPFVMRPPLTAADPLGDYEATGGVDVGP